MFEEKLKQENARLRNLLRWVARLQSTPAEVSGKILLELDGLPDHRQASALIKQEHDR